ncbi:MAG: Cobalt-zinc-cadmium resistance protein [uncultured Chthoniobacterales bacterium]|uniref:Cobalt-zinc-cadmium resistance protein n=1 Tax=uncultured Chthoniobacterales bacterium TaxID=1836801 RepID=A0A6J4IDP5_9BACT|nr:MAG: Cobalt-zinc-cadmium resistance protein [uncultured Chthoniobacterales bacterium]
MAPAAHPHVSTSSLQSGARIALLGMVINAALAIAKIVAGVLGNAYVLIADGIESTLDIAGSVVIWGGLKVAARPPDESHPYGHGKAEPVAAAIVAGGVIAAAIGLAVQSAREIVTPHHAPAPFTLVVLIVVVVVKELLYRSVIRLGRDVESTAVQTDAWHHRSDALTSLAAFVGISIALLGGPGWESADDWAALFACGLIGVNGIRLLSPALHEIMDTAPRGGMSDTVRTAAASVSGVVEVEKCLIRKMGLHFYVDLHVGVDGAISVRDGHDIAHEVKHAIQAKDPRIADVLVHVEPATTDS